MAMARLEILELSNTRQKQIELARRGRGWFPGWDESWWWLWVPVGFATLSVTAYRLNEAFYYDVMLPEGFGVLEFSQFVFATAGLLIAARLYVSPYVRAWPFLKWSIAVFAFCCFYIAGEEQSWGQHFFHWDTPQSWAQWNRQNETNLHNAFNAINYVPSVTLELGVFTGGILIPLYERFVGSFRRGLLQLFSPPIELMPAAITATAFKLAKIIGSDDVSPLMVPNPNEAVETFLYIFMLYYLIVFARRVRLLQSVSTS